MGLVEKVNAFLRLVQNENPILCLIENPKSFLFGALAALSIFAAMPKSAGAQAAPAQATPAPVSYTHLDVYKRQGRR